MQGSGIAGWATGSAPASGLYGFVAAGVAVASARNIVTVKERGTPNHHKNMGEEPIEVTVTYLQAVTANMAEPATGSGVSVPIINLELKHLDDELGDETAQWTQYHNGVLLSRGWTEGEEGNTFDETWRFLSMNGPTATGFLS